MWYLTASVLVEHKYMLPGRELAIEMWRVLFPSAPLSYRLYNLWQIHNVCDIRVWSQCVVTAGLRFILGWWVSYRAGTRSLLPLRCYLCKFCWTGLLLWKCTWMGMLQSILLYNNNNKTLAQCWWVTRSHNGSFSR